MTNIFDDTAQLSIDSNNELESEAEFITLYDELVSDIGRIDVKITELQRYITMIDSNISYMEKLISSEQDVDKKIKYQKVMKNLMELMVSYQDIYQKFLTVKQNYRKHQNTSIRDRFKIKIDFEKRGSRDNGDISISQLVEMFSKIQTQLDSTNKDNILEDLDDINADDTYSLT